MEFSLRRIEEIGETTLGELILEGEHICWTLEDKVREPEEFIGIKNNNWVKEWKVPERTAIPRGRYALAINWSKKFGLLLPEVLSVPGFGGIRIHPGNKKEDTEGCILLGLGRIGDKISDSKKAQGLFISLISRTTSRGIELKEPTWLQIS